VILPRAYGLPKIHKIGYSLRIIVSCSGSPLHNLALFLHKILVKSLPPSFSYIKNSLQLLRKLSNLHVLDECCLTSFDVVSLFTNVPTDMVLEIIEEKWPYIEMHTNLPLSEFILSTRFVLQSTFILTINFISKSLELMGSPLSSIIAEFCRFVWNLVCNLLLIEEKIRSSGYPLSKRTLIMKSKLVFWTQDETTGLLCLSSYTWYLSCVCV